MSNCVNLKKKLNGNIYCKKINKQITFKECSCCEFKEFKMYKSMKKHTYKQYKKEKERYSIIYKNLSKCCVKGCLTPFYQVEKNEVFEGAFRNRSITHGAVCPFCKNHHDLFHNNSLFNLEYKILFQNEYANKYSLEWFVKTFGQDYSIKYEKIKSTNHFG
ncbi:MAG: hypothetical protein HFE81_07560 [Bacilli bacterium]|nr:hypothetical protein [Bacilli bacterium]